MTPGRGDSNEARKLSKTLLIDQAALHQHLTVDDDGLDVASVVAVDQRLDRAVRVDEPALLRDVQAEGQRLWHAVPQWHWSRKPLDEIVPPSYPVWPA